ncbi:MAG: hypothetical protein Q4C12_07610 [Clostridia bacterium]|nr:hypothetical protein [Clostridia bacterium]
MNEHIKSAFSDEQELLSSILKIHNNGSPIELDPMFHKGGFYKNLVERPKYIFDINPLKEYCPKGNAESLPFENGQISCMILDPLFLFGIHGKTRQYCISQNMGILESFDELQRHYKAILKEAYRVLRQNGVLIFKCQDYTDSKTIMTHCLVYNWATMIGFYAKDIAILIRANKISNPKTTQRHFRKIHTYFWVFVKKNRGGICES